MKYQIGDTPLYNWYGDILIPCKVLKCYPNTNKYRIEHNGNTLPRIHQSIVRETDLYNSQIEMIDSAISLIMRQISGLQEQLVKIQEKRNELTMKEVK